jgi:hypothetical protein
VHFQDEVMEFRRFGNGMTAQDRLRGQYVEPAVFLAEMTSRRALQRSDENGATVRGLLDPETGQRILISEEHLFAALRDEE